MTAATITNQKGWGHHEQHSTYRAERPHRGYARQPQRARSSRDGEHISQSCQPDRQKSRPAAALGKWAWCWPSQAEGTGDGDTAGGCGNRQQAETAAAKGLQAAARPRRVVRWLSLRLLPMREM